MQVQLNPSTVFAQVAPFLHGLLAHSLTSKGNNEAEFLNTLPTKKEWERMRPLVENNEASFLDGMRPLLLDY